MEAKPPSFVPMPLYNLPIQPQGVEIVLWHLVESSEQSLEWKAHFPHREESTMSLLRQNEHRAVTYAITQMMGHDQWHLSHDLNGKPSLHLSGRDVPCAVSIAHVTQQGEIWAAVAKWNDGRTTGGIDLAFIHDPRVKRVASRVMSQEEQIRWQGHEAWVWATKEAMFKGHGPNLEFRSQALLRTAPQISQVQQGVLHGEVRDSPWEGAWMVLPNDMLLVWGA